MTDPLEVGQLRRWNRGVIPGTRRRNLVFRVTATMDTSGVPICYWDWTLRGGHQLGPADAVWAAENSTLVQPAEPQRSVGVGSWWVWGRATAKPYEVMALAPDGGQVYLKTRVGFSGYVKPKELLKHGRCVALPGVLYEPNRTKRTKPETAATDYKALCAELTAKLAQSVAQTAEALETTRAAVAQAQAAVEQSERIEKWARGTVERAVEQAEEWKRTAAEAFSTLHRITSRTAPETIHHTRITSG